MILRKFLKITTAPFAGQFFCIQFSHPSYKTARHACIAYLAVYYIRSIYSEIAFISLSILWLTPDLVSCFAKYAPSSSREAEG